MKKRFLITLAAAAALFCLLATSAFANGTDLKQTNGNVNMRTGPGTGYSVITVVPVGTNVFIVEDNGQGWSYVDYNGTQGWVSSSYLGGYAPAAAPAVSDYGDYTVTTDVNLRAGPGTGYDVYIVVPGGSTVEGGSAFF